jgi:signal transduction histidine kinase
MSKKSISLLLSLCIILAFLFFLIADNFDSIKNRYKEIEPNLDNYAAAEVLILSFERMRMELLTSKNNDLDDYFFRMGIFESKIKILENKSATNSSFYYDDQFIRLERDLKSKGSYLRLMSEKFAVGDGNKEELFVIINEMDGLLIDLQEVIYEIQIRHFDEVKSIIKDNSKEALFLTNYSFILFFVIIFFVVKNAFYLKEIIKQKNLFISSIYHELASSTQAIVMAADIIEHELIDDRLKSEAMLISRNANRIIEQTKEIMDYSKLEMMKVTINKSNFYINDLIVNALEELHRIKQNDFKFYKSSRKLMISSDKYKVYRIIVNLLDNSNKYTTQGLVTIHVKIIKNGLFIFVKDNGSGFNMNNINYFFKAFNQGAEKDTKQGLGLGLTIIKSYIESLKGKLIVKSVVGVGSSFLVYLPIELVEEKA